MRRATTAWVKPWSVEAIARDAQSRSHRAEALGSRQENLRPSSGVCSASDPTPARSCDQPSRQEVGMTTESRDLVRAGRPA